MTYSASLEWVHPKVAVMRLHEGENGRYGDPFVWSAVVVNAGKCVAELKGVTKAPPVSATRAIHAALLANGFVRRAHDRIKAGRSYRVSRSL